MAWWLGRKVRSVDILPDTIRTDHIQEYHGDVSCSSGGAATVDFVVSHNLGSARIYGTTLLSHASGGGVEAKIGSVNASQITIRYQNALSGQVVVSGMPAHVFVMA